MSFINLFSLSNIVQNVSLLATASITDKAFVYIAAAVALLASFGVAIGQGYIGGKAVESIARNPEAEPLIFKQFIVAVAICESVAIYCLIISLIIIFSGTST